ncbi:MAG: sulfatase-like hydrolase/transferase [Bacteroidales bacterium]|nr:sulfatase-like hydrolase/transferase [Bacteroidales bacterium]
MKIKQSPYSTIIATLCNLALAYVVFMLCRIVYVWENWSLFAPGWDALNMGDLLRGSLRYDSSAIFYTNGLYLILMLLPLLAKERQWWHTMTKWVYMVINSLVVIVNLSDAVYSQYTGRRTTSTFFHEFSNEGNLGGIIFTEMWNHWYLVLAAIALILLMWVLYVKPDFNDRRGVQQSRLTYYVFHGVLFVLLFPVAVVAMRGGLTRTTRPITIANANQYVNQPHEAAIVLNTPFSVIRTIGKTTFVDPHYFDQATMTRLFTPVHMPPDSLAIADSTSLWGRFKGRNVVVIIIESFAREYIGYYHNGPFAGTCPGMDGYRGYTPFFDSLMGLSLTWQETYANGRKSIDAMPSILSSIPMFIEPFFTTSYSLNRVSGLAAELAKEGYSSAFFHGADNGSMGFQAFARSTGFQKYFGRFEYDDDPSTPGDKDYDGTWAIWDEPFLQYYVSKMNTMKQPFITSVFTASSHHPYNIPKQYKDIYPDEELPIYKCIRYTDNALRRFFESARQQPWYDNTIFVITNDHTNLTNYDIYRTAQGVFRGTVVFFDPRGELPTGVMPGMAQQIDIMPTLLSLLGYQRPYVAFGRDLLSSADSSLGWTVNYSNGIYQYLQNDTLIQFDGHQVLKAFDTKNDPMMYRPLRSHPSIHEQRLKAIIQQYMQRMINDELAL